MNRHRKAGACLQAILRARELKSRGSRRPPPILSLISFLFLAAASAFAAGVTSPAKNWILPLFTKEGYRSITARGSEARLSSPREFQVKDLNLTFFSEDPATTVETVILSPAATFLPDEKRAHGENHVRFIRDDVEASGTRWIYWHADKKISLDGDVRVTFHAEMKDLLR
jgi:hypothetical protein